MKYIIVLCLQHNKRKIKNEKKNRLIIKLLLTQKRNEKNSHDE